MLYIFIYDRPNLNLVIEKLVMTNEHTLCGSKLITFINN